MAAHGFQAGGPRSPSRIGLAALVAANLAVVLQAALRGWGYYETLLVYWLEALVIGGFNALRLLVGRAFYTLLGTGFFAFQFAGFALAVGIFVIALPAAIASPGGAGGARVMEGIRAAGPGVAIAVAVLIVSHGFSFTRNFLLGREFARLSVVGLIFWPYARMFLVALVLSLGLVLAKLRPGVGGTTAFAVLMVLMKLAADAATHLWEHRSFASRVEAGAPNGHAT